MFNVGGGEVLVIAFIALIVLGPQRLPDAARQAGKAIGELRRLSSGFQNELRDAFSDAELTSPVADAPRRDVLAQPPVHTAPPAAVESVSGQAPRRREPLRAAPANNRKTASPLPKGTKPRGKGA
ncbi:MAG: Sec-independent protein translocase protein TatB [Microthrixaceae bacterium]